MAVARRECELALRPHRDPGDRADRVLHPPRVIVARIQGHPARAHLHHALAASLEIPTELRLHSSDPPNPFLGYCACLSDLPDCSHLVVIQDDAKVCANFGQAIEAVALRNAHVPVSLFLMPLPLRIARQAVREAKNRALYFDAHFRINEFMPAVGVLWPVEKAREFLRWVEENPRRLGHRQPRSDDSVLGKWCANTHQTIRFTIPSLVEHMADQPSVKGGPTPASKMKALWFTEDGADFEW